MYDKPNPIMTGAATLGRGSPKALSVGGADAAMFQTAEGQQPQLSRTSQRLHHCIQELDGLVAKLESALDPVLNPPSPANAAGASTVPPQPVRCPLGMSMDARSDEVCEISARVRSLLERLAC